MLLYEHLENKFSRMSAFPKALRKALVGDRPLVPRGQAPTFGSPLLDFELNYGWPLGYVQDELERELDIMTPKVLPPTTTGGQKDRMGRASA